MAKEYRQNTSRAEYLKNIKREKIVKECLMYEIDGFDMSRFDEYGVTPEQARDKAIEILESVRFNRKSLERYMKPIEEIDYFHWDIIESLMYREDEVRDFAAEFEDGLSLQHNAMMLEMYLNP